MNEISEEKRLGSKLLGRYEILSYIQKGGMGTVFLGRHLELEKTVAIKIFHRHLTEEKELVARFINEARGIAKLQHRNIVNVFDIGSDDEGIPFFVMEYLTGESLRDRLSRIEVLSIKAVTDIMIQILSGLQVAHSRGIIHRDLKPGNIFLSIEEDGSEVVKILDFGVAKFRDIDPEKKTEITTDGSILGTPSYMSPEQASGKKGTIDHRSDIYSCGVMLFRCLTGINVFKGDSLIETVQNILYTKHDPPSFFNESLPSEVDGVVLKAIEVNREKRFKDCRDFIEALKTFYPLSGTSPGELVAKIVSDEMPSVDISLDKMDQSTVVEVPASGDYTASTSSRTARAKAKAISKPRRLLAFLAISLVAAAGLIAGWYFFIKDRQEVQPATEKKAHIEDRRGPEKKIETVEHDPEPPPVKKDLVEIEVVGLMPGALVNVNGNKVEGNPFKLERSETPVAVSISYKGEIILEKSLAPLENEQIHVDIPQKKKISKTVTKPIRKGKVKKGGAKKKTKEPSAAPEKKAAAEEEWKAPKKIIKDFPDFPE